LLYSLLLDFDCMVDSEDFEEKLSSVPINAEEGIVGDELLVVTLSGILNARDVCR
jgi:hypothetical protein